MYAPPGRAGWTEEHRKWRRESDARLAGGMARLFYALLAVMALSAAFGPTGFLAAVLVLATAWVVGSPWFQIAGTGHSVALVVGLFHRARVRRWNRRLGEAANVRVA